MINDSNRPILVMVELSSDKNWELDRFSYLFDTETDYVKYVADFVYRYK